MERSPVPVLVTISFSHYCEKARWALDRAGLPYREEPYAPVVHMFGTLHRGGRSVPLLALPDGRALTDSTEILHYVDDHRPGLLYPHPEDAPARAKVDELEDLFDEELGPHARRLGYHALLSSGAPFAPVIRATTGGLQRRLAPVLGAIVPRLLERGLRIDDAGAARSRGRVQAVLDRVESLLADGRRYLVGDRFTAADLTFAALAGPLMAPEQQPVTSRLEMPPGYAEMADPYRRRPAGTFALRVYREERARVVS
jgi:glutathione S-transferase